MTTEIEKRREQERKRIYAELERRREEERKGLPLPPPTSDNEEGGW